MASRKSATSANPSQEVDDKVYLEHIKKINDVYYDQVALADRKATYIFTFMIAFLISSTEGRQIFNLQRYQTGDLISMILSGVVGLALVVSLVATVLVVLPRNSKESTSLYWGGWAVNRTKLLNARQQRDEHYIFDEYLSNVDALAAISRSKFACLRVAFRGFVIVVLGYVLLLLWQVGASG